MLEIRLYSLQVRYFLTFQNLVGSSDKIITKHGKGPVLGIGILFGQSFDYLGIREAGYHGCPHGCESALPQLNHLFVLLEIELSGIRHASQQKNGNYTGKGT